MKRIILVLVLVFNFYSTVFSQLSLEIQPKYAYMFHSKLHAKGLSVTYNTPLALKHLPFFFSFNFTSFTGSGNRNFNANHDPKTYALANANLQAENSIIKYQPGRGVTPLEVFHHAKIKTSTTNQTGLELLLSGIIYKDKDFKLIASAGVYYSRIAQHYIVETKKAKFSNPNYGINQDDVIVTISFNQLYSLLSFKTSTSMQYFFNDRLYTNLAIEYYYMEKPFYGIIACGIGVGVTL
jgi:hypothetical protein